MQLACALRREERTTVIFELLVLFTEQKVICCICLYWLLEQQAQTYSPLQKKMIALSTQKIMGGSGDSYLAAACLAITQVCNIQLQYREFVELCDCM